MSFLPQNYQAPTASTPGNYLRFKQGVTRFRILSEEAVTGWIYWSEDNKPIRLKEKPKTDRPEGIRFDDKGKPEKVKHFWVVVVFDYDSSQPCILEITQATIQRSIEGLASDPDWGHPSLYDLKVTRSGSGLETEYHVAPVPHKEFDYAQAKGWEQIDLDKLFVSGDPFTGEASAPRPTQPQPQPQPQPTPVIDEFDNIEYGALGFSSVDQLRRAWLRFNGLKAQSQFLGIASPNLTPEWTNLDELTKAAVQLKDKIAALEKEEVLAF